MKTHLRFGAVLTALAVLGTGCAAAAAQPAPSASARKVPVTLGVAASVPAADAQPYAAGDTAFGLDLLRAWCARAPGQNMVFSPATLASSLGMAYLGAHGKTAAAMARALHLPAGTDLAGLHARAKALGSLDGPGVTVSANDQVWADPSLPTSAAYLNAVATAYRAGIARVATLTDPARAARQINDAIAAATHGHIRDLLSPDQLRGIGWVLTAAMYMQADWASPFQSGETFRQQFTTATGNRVSSPFMHGEVRVGSAAGWQSAVLPYQGGKLSMVAMLPPSSAAGCTVPSAPILAALASATGNGTVALPKVNLTSKSEVSDLLRGLGMGAAFDQAAADFTGISPKAGAIGFVQQAATLRVDEKGTVASAAAGTGIIATAAPAGPQVVFDRPYLLLISTSAGEPLFLARVANPLGS